MGETAISRPPNILFLMSDEHRADVAGFAGDPIVRTPTLDRLAADGVVFQNAYTPSPICIPGRQAMMAGQLPRTCGCERYGQDLAPDSLTFAKRLAQYGYHTLACGKLHHLGFDQMQGWTERVAGDTRVVRAYRRDDGTPAAARGELAGPSLKWSDAKEIKRAGIGRGPCIAQDEFTLHGALDAIERIFTDPDYDRPRPAEQPLLLKVSLLQPHYPYLTDRARFTYYLNRVRPYLDETPSEHPALSRRAVRVGIHADEREIRRATAAYYGMIENADEQFGRILSALEHVGQDLDEWLIIYTSDHGEMLGQHGVWEKQKFYEGSARVPLIIHRPRQFAGGRVVRQNVNLCDLFATLCDAAGVPQPPGLDSRSLMPLLAGDSTGWNNETISQFGGRHLMIKRDDLKYQDYGSDGPEVLFDLAHDPDELRNVIDDPRYAAAVDRFRERRAELGFGPDAGSSYVNAGYAAS